MRTICLALVAAALLAGCGASSPKLGDGRWYGKLLAVDVAQRRLEFAPVCFARPRRWVAGGGGHPFTVGVAAHPDLSIYYRPGGNAAEGHGQGVDLHQLAQDFPVGLPDSPPGWYVDVRNGVVTVVAEDSGLRSSDPSDERNNACVWSKRTQAFVK